MQQLVEHAADFMSMELVDGSLTYINKAGRKLVGLDAEEDLSLLSLNNFYPEEQRTVIDQEVLPDLTEKGHWSGFLKVKHRHTGEEIPCYGNYALVWDTSTGKATSRALTLRDLRPDLQARKELEESEKRFRNLVQEAPVATAIYVGREMKIQWANDAMIKLWGKDKTVIGKTVREALPEIEDQPFHGQLDRVFTTGEMYQATEDKGELMVEGRLQTFYFNFSYKPLRDADGQVYGILNMAIDVTDMVDNKRKLEESEKAFRNLIMQAPVGICLLTGNNFIVDIANEQYLELVGRKKEALINRPVWEALPEAKAQGYDLLLDSVKQTGKPYFGNEQAVELLRNGTIETVYLNFVYEPLFDDRGEVHSILVIAIDISQQVKLRQQIEHAEERARLAVGAGNMGTYE
ncbi:MAG TPA: PAS domain S-box protein, partial [Flavisolibacter sp.]|nr:PAS domain S-box protein [Flavisolibacter sp.]